MIKKIDITVEENAKAVLYVQKEAYSIEAEIVDYYDLPVLTEDVEDIMWSDEHFYGFYEESKLLGVISFQIKDRIMDICRLAVLPDHHRKGIASGLLKFVENLESEVEKIVVTTAFGNTPAEEFYTAMGYNLEDVYEKDEDEDGYRVAKFEKDFLID